MGEPSNLSDVFLRFDDFRVANIGSRQDLWEVQGRRDGEWFDVFDDPDLLLAKEVVNWLNEKRKEFVKSHEP
jgi:hypothetical protein